MPKCVTVADCGLRTGNSVVCSTGATTPWREVPLRESVLFVNGKHAACVNTAHRWGAGVHKSWCDIIISSLLHTVWRSYVCDVAAPCRFAWPWLKMSLRAQRAAGERDRGHSSTDNRTFDKLQRFCFSVVFEGSQPCNTHTLQWTLRKVLKLCHPHALL